MIVRLLAASAVVFAVAAPGAHFVARDFRPATARQTFKTGTELVTIPLAVSSRGSNPRIDNLTAADFRILEDGVEQTVTLVDRERRPLSLCIVLDSSSSMSSARRDLAIAAIQQTMAALLPNDEVALVAFSHEVHVPIPWTSAAAIPPIDWAGWQTVGGTALNDALKAALELIEAAQNPRAAILFVSDGFESASTIKLEHVVSTRRQSETLVYAFRTDDWTQRLTQSFSRGEVSTAPRTPGQSPTIGITPTLRAAGGAGQHLNELVGDSGGMVFNLLNAPDAERYARALMDELRSLYTIGYAPVKPPDGKYRRIKVEPRNKNLRVRHRGGYLAVPSKQP